MLWEAAWAGLAKAAHTLLTVADIMIPLFVVLQAVRELGWLDRLAGVLRPALRPLDLPADAAVPLVTFLVFGMSIGTALLLEEEERLGWSRRQVTVVCTLASVAHALPDEAIVFVPLGANAWLGAGLRLGLGVLAGWAAARWLPTPQVRHRNSSTAS